MAKPTTKRKSPPKPTTKSPAKPKSDSQAGNLPNASIDSSMPVTWDSSGKGGDNGRDKASITNAENGNTDGVTDSGNVTPTADGDGLPADGAVLVARARPGETKSACWERLRKEARLAGLPRGQGIGTAYEWATVEADRLFPPIEEPEPAAEIPEPMPVEAEPDPPAPDGLAGLSEIPADWPELPDNAALPAEVQWVQANRVRVRDGNRVDLSRSRSSAPSYAALSWLETAILFPAKWADIVAKAATSQVDEREHTRRERIAIESVGGLLSDMVGVGEPTT